WCSCESEAASSELLPKLPPGDRGPVRERLQLRPRELRVDAAAEPTVGAGNDRIASDEASEAADAIGDELGMLDDVGGVADDAGDEDLAGRQLDVFPDSPLVLVAHVAGFEGVRLAVHRQHHIDDVAHRDVGDVRAVPAAPAQMKTDPMGGQPAQRM